MADRGHETHLTGSCPELAAPDSGGSGDWTLAIATPSTLIRPATADHELIEWS